MAAESKREIVVVTVDEEGDLRTADGRLLTDVVPEPERVDIGTRRRKREYIYVHMPPDAGNELELLETPGFDPDRIAAEISRRGDVEAIEVPLGEVDEPRPADIEDSLKAVADLGVTVHVQLPR